MAHKIIWSAKAADNLEFACDKLALFSGERARQFAAAVIEQIEKLEKFPLMGRIVPEYNDSHTRELIFEDYRLIYRVENEAIKIGQIRHGKMLLDEKPPF